mmetsp:Transcript_111160/g.321329  ORF Transcript_111160/g.321329 Transcript_111160/m.321329 type:complete len:221 (-) Transcript_111160:443-1105(-)
MPRQNARLVRSKIAVPMRCTAPAPRKTSMTRPKDASRVSRAKAAAISGMQQMPLRPMGSQSSTSRKVAAASAMACNNTAEGGTEGSPSLEQRKSSGPLAEEEDPASAEMGRAPYARYTKSESFTHDDTTSSPVLCIICVVSDHTEKVSSSWDVQKARRRSKAARIGTKHSTLEAEPKIAAASSISSPKISPASVRRDSSAASRSANSSKRPVSAAKTPKP